MKPQGLTLEQALHIAKERVLPAGYKPEDYLIVNDSLPLKIASLVVKEALHLMKASQYGSQA